MDKDRWKVVGKYAYNTRDVLGIGVWGTVYRAHLHCEQHEPQSHKQYALKKMNKYKVEANAKSLAKFKEQVLALQKAADIEEVVAIIDFFKSRNNYYIITQYFPQSSDLYAYMQTHRSKFCEAEARVIWRDLMVGLDKLHSLGIYHRDVKLDNIIYLPLQGKAKIIDFGMAECLGTPEGFHGSLLCMSPQVFHGLSYTQKCDVWSLGIVFYEMITQISVYGKEPTKQAIVCQMESIRNGKLSFPETKLITEECKQVIVSCLQWQQHERPELKSLLALPFFFIPHTPQLFKQNILRQWGRFKVSQVTSFKTSPQSV